MGSRWINFRAAFRGHRFGGSISDQEFEMEFLAGFHGYSQDPLTLAVRPEIGWCVADGVGSSGEA